MFLHERKWLESNAVYRTQCSYKVRESYKSNYSVLNDGDTRNLYAKSLWGLRIPLKTQILVWLVLKGRLSTTDNLAKSGWVGSILCAFCGCENETIDHLFVGSVFTRFVSRMGDAATWLGNSVMDARGVWKMRMASEGPAARNKILSYLSTT